MKSEFFSAQNQLRVIRALMERATIYRSVSALTAAVGGTLSLIASVGIYFLAKRGFDQIHLRDFVAIWGAVLVLTLLVNFIRLWWGNRRRQEPYLSAGLKLALWSVTPPAMLSIFVTALLLYFDPGEAEVFFLILANSWCLFYGLALLGTQHFAPRSLVVLGWSFFLTPLVSLFLQPRICTSLYNTWEISAIQATALYMAITFGGYHLIYAGLIWWRGEERPELSPETAIEHV